MSFLHHLKIFLFFILGILILIYGLYKINNYFLGPKLIIKFPIDGQEITTETFYLEGNIKNVKNIFINGKEINIDQQGNFKEEIITHSPLTIINIEAIDKYKKTLKKVLKVVKK